MKRQRETLGLLALAMLVLLSACAALKPKAPEVSLSAVRFVELGLIEQRFALTLKISNPNAGDFVVTGLVYEAEVGGKSFAGGRSSQRVVLTGGADTLIEVPTTARLAHLFKGLLGGLDAALGGQGAGALDYRIHGQIEIEGMGSWPFDRKGKVLIGGGTKAQPPEGGKR